MYEDGFVQAVGIAYTSMCSLRKVAKLFDVGLSTVKRWKKLGWKRVRDHRSKITPSILVLLRGIVRHAPYLTCTDIRHRVHEALGWKPSRQLVSVALRKAGVSRVRTRLAVPEVAKERQARSYAEYVEQFQQYLREKKTIVALDETGVDERVRPVQGYVQKGRRLCFPRQSGGWTRHSILMTITSAGVLSFERYRGAVNSDRFLSFLKAAGLPRGSVLLMDNVSFHKTKRVHEWMTQNDVTALYTPAYAPDTNPIEHVFSILKASYRGHAAHEPVSTVDDRLDHAINTLLMAPADMFSRCFDRATRHCQEILGGSEGRV